MLYFFLSYFLLPDTKPQLLIQNIIELVTKCFKNSNITLQPRNGTLFNFETILVNKVYGLCVSVCLHYIWYTCVLSTSTNIYPQPWSELLAHNLGKYGQRSL